MVGDGEPWLPHPDTTSALPGLNDFPDLGALGREQESWGSGLTLVEKLLKASLVHLEYRGRAGSISPWPKDAFVPVSKF